MREILEQQGFLFDLRLGTNNNQTLVFTERFFTKLRIKVKVAEF